MRPPRKIIDSKGKAEPKEKKAPAKPLPKLLTAGENRDTLKAKHTLDKRRQEAAKIKQKKLI
jgi:hypothetical protein